MKTLYEYICEAKADDFGDVKKEDKTFKEIMSGLSKRGMKYAGTMYWTNKTVNGFVPEEMRSIFTYYMDMKKSVFGKNADPAPLRGLMSALDVYTGKMKIEDWPGIGNPKSKEEVVRFFDKDMRGRMQQYFCFYNESAKYYYMINLTQNSDWMGGWDLVHNAFQAWLDVKTKTDSQLKSEFQAAKDEEDRKSAERKKEIEAYHKKKAEEDAAKKRLEDVKDKLKAIQDSILDHYEKRKDLYKVQQYEKLPKEVKDDLHAYDRAKTEDEYKKVLAGKYFMTSKRTGSDPGNVHYLAIVNTADHKNPYAYEYSVRNGWSLD